MARGRPRPLVAGNWKMNGLGRSTGEVGKLARFIDGAADRAGVKRPPCDIMVCPPATLVAVLADAARETPIAIGGQDCHAKPSGAHTGDISAEMLRDAGARAVIVGHSERRADHGETSVMVRAKAEAAHRARLTAIVCIGETRVEHEAGQTLSVIARQLQESLPETAMARNLVVAYEPVWAIGTGLTPTPEGIGKVHAAIREHLAGRYDEGARMRILYGGSVKPGNAAEILGVDNVNGALVGGASLKARDFFGIIRTYY